MTHPAPQRAEPALTAVRSACVLLAIVALTSCQRSDPPTANAPAISTGASVPLVAASVTSAEAQPFEIKGEVKDVPDGERVLIMVTESALLEQTKPKPLVETEVRNGKFSLSGQVSQPQVATLYVGQHLGAQMVIEKNTNYQAQLTPAGMVVVGGTINDQAYAYARQPDYVAAVQRKNEISERTLKGLNMQDEAAVKKARAVWGKAEQVTEKIKDDFQDRILSGNSPAMVKLAVLVDNADWDRYDANRRAALADALEKELGPVPALTYLRKMAQMNQESNAQDSVGVGKPMVDLTLLNRQGQSVQLSQVVRKNTLVLLDFWASWCGPCRAEFVHLRKVHKAFQAKGFEIYSVSVDEDRSAWLKALDEEKTHWINVVDPTGLGGPAAKMYGVRGLPSNFLIRKDGTIVGVNLREWDVERMVKAQIESP